LHFFSKGGIFWPSTYATLSTRIPANAAGDGSDSGGTLLARRTLLVLTLLLAFIAIIPGPALADEGGNPTSVYFPQTGHKLSLGFLDFWRLNGGVTVFGYPITDEMADPQTGQTVQYFERAVFEYHAEAPEDQRVQLRPLDPADRINGLIAFSESQRRYQHLAAFAFAGIPLSQPFARIDTAPDTNDRIYFPETGHTVAMGFQDFWERHGGADIFGNPTTEEYMDPASGYSVQYFERAVFEWHAEGPGAPHVELRNVGTRAAARASINTAPVPQAEDIPTYDPNLWNDSGPANPTDVTTPLPGAPTGAAKWIEVDLSQQYIRAWEHKTVVFGQYVSTGLAKHPTPTGYFRIFAKLPFDDMTNGPAAPADDFYDLKDVPNVMYFETGGYAIHGTYWHTNFGRPQSHGCVNMTRSGSGWLFNWAPYRTTVWVHD
jgi:lipoprotein-anchoring transpeptidase ErfK/SrfK